MAEANFTLPDGINKDDYNWTEPIIGLSLTMFRGAVIDSYGNKIDDDVFYVVGKAKDGGKTIIMPTDRNQKQEFKNDVMNNALKDKGQLN